MRTVVAVGLCLALAAISASAQEATPAASPAPATDKPQVHSGTPLGQFTVGPLIVTPTVRIGTLAIDTNVRYGGKKITDFLASAGPGLDLSLPFDHWKFNVESSAQYFYFYKAEELRQWTGFGAASLFWKTTGTRATISFGVNRVFGRPSYEVDIRVAQTIKNFSAEMERDLGRLTLVARGLYDRTRTDDGQTYRGRDISTALSTDRFRGDVQFQYRVTPLSAILVEGGYEENHFPEASVRNYAQENAGVGIKTDAFLKGEVAVGVRRTHLLQEGGIEVLGTVTRPYLRLNLTQRLGPRFRLTEIFNDQTFVSAYAVDGRLPTYLNRELRIDLLIKFTSRIDMTLGATRAHLVSDGALQLVLDSGEVQVARRDDLYYEPHADLGIRLGRARVSAFVSYTTRKAGSFSDFGVQGLQTGARVEYAPQ